MRLDYRANQDQSPSYKKVEYAEGYMVAYLADAPMVTATIYLGKSKKPFKNYRFKDLEQRERYISTMAETIATNRKLNAEADAKRKVDRKEHTKRFIESLLPGKILYDTWGYEQTNVEFYEVIRRVGSKVTVRELGHQELRATGWASNVVMPATGDNRFCGQETTVNVRGPYVKISDCITLHDYDGGEVHKSWYA